MHAHTKSHWSSPATKEAFIRELYKVYVEATINDRAKKMNVSPKQVWWIMLVDVHSSNRYVNSTMRARVI